MGVIHVPCSDELYASAFGFGATLNGKSLRLDPTRNLQNAMTGIGCNSYVTPNMWVRSSPASWPGAAISFAMDRAR